MVSSAPGAPAPPAFAPPKQVSGTRVVLSPHEPLVEGGAAEEFERSIQELLTGGHRHLVVDLAGVSRIDGGGVRALVRGYTTARRLGGSFRLACANADVRSFLQVVRLDGVFPISESVEQARAREWPWRTIGLIAAGAVFCLALVWGGTAASPDSASTAPSQLDFGLDEDVLPGGEPFLALLKLVVAAGIGLLVTFVHRPTARDKPLSRSMEQAQVLLCVAGAMVMIIIGNSIARAFGIAGAASIIRFRTPVEDPKDITILFLLMGLGMAAGLGAFAVAGLATAFLCLFLLMLERLPSDQTPREMTLELVAEGRQFPLVHVESVFARNGVIFEPRNVSQGKEATVKYHVALERDLSLEELSAQLTAAHAGIRSVTWKDSKKSGR
ncbi:MAG: STAS domain-containing protein [Acidobacteria bacterium]|nr:STAS domain-containing protein [Acidobacteriota bacterium]